MTEGSLPTHCPGHIVHEEQQDDIFSGKLDFENDEAADFKQDMDDSESVPPEAVVEFVKEVANLGVILR